MVCHFAMFVRARQLQDVAKTSVAFFHDWKAPPIRVGDTLVGVPTVPIEGGSWHLDRGLGCTVTDVSEVRLLEELTEQELARLNCDLDTFFESWDKIHPDVPAESNPLVLRVQFEPTDEVIERPMSAEASIAYTIARRAYDDIIAIEDARVFADIRQATG